jgi:hypothetical protein
VAEFDAPHLQICDDLYAVHKIKMKSKLKSGEKSDMKSVVKSVVKSGVKLVVMSHYVMSHHVSPTRLLATVYPFLF